MRAIVISIVVGALFVAATSAEEKLYSGPQPGERLTPFRAMAVIQPGVTEEVEIAKPKTTLIMFVHKITEPAVGLMITVEWYAHQQKDVTGHYVVLTEDRSQTLAQVQRWASRPFFAGSPISVSLDGPEGPGRYGLNRRHADMTVLIAKDNQVVHNFALTAANNTDAPTILKALAETQGVPEPSVEAIRDELRAARQKRREKRMRETPLFKLAPNPALGQLMVRMVSNEGANESNTKRVSDEMTAWAGDDAEKKAALITYSNAVLKGPFELNRYARESLRKLVEAD